VRGGKRPNSGRKPGSKNSYRYTKKDFDDISKQVLNEVNTVALWKKVLRSSSMKVVTQALMYLMDRAYGRPAQTIQGGTQPVRIEFSWAGTPEWMTSSMMHGSGSGRLETTKTIYQSPGMISEVVEAVTEELMEDEA